MERRSFDLSEAARPPLSRTGFAPSVDKLLVIDASHGLKTLADAE